MATSVMQVSVDDELKASAAAICEEIGIDLPTAIRMFMKRMVFQKGIPFSMTLPNRPYDGIKGVLALHQLSEEAKQNGTANMTLEEINEEIAASRREMDEREKAERAAREGSRT